MVLSIILIWLCIGMIGVALNQKGLIAVIRERYSDPAIQKAILSGVIFLGAIGFGHYLLFLQFRVLITLIVYRYRIFQDNRLRKKFRKDNNFFF